MATRLYFSTATALNQTPGFDASWEKTSTAATRKVLDTTKADTAYASVADGTTGNVPAGAFDVCIGQWISAPLASGVTISGAIAGQMRASESSATGDLRLQTVIRVFQSDYSTVRGTLIASSAAALSSEFNTALRNISIPLGGSTVPTSVAALTGDVIVVELGYRKHENATTSRTGTFDTGAVSGGTDLPVDQTTLTQGVPWIEFTETLTFADTPTRASYVAAQVAVTPPTVEARASFVAAQAAVTPSSVEARVSAVYAQVAISGGVLGSTVTGSFTANAVVQRTQAGSLTVNAVRTATISSSLTADAVQLRSWSSSWTADAYKTQPQASSFPVDAVLLRAQSSSFTADAFKTQVGFGAFTAESVIKRTQSGSLTADAVELVARTSSFTASAWLVVTTTGSFTVNAVLRKTISGSLTADAFISAPGGGVILADAIKRQTQDWRSMISRAAPRLWYRCDDASGGLIDYGAEARNASTVSGSPTYGAAGRIDGAVSLSGSQAFATATFALNLTTSIITIEAWVWPGTASYTGSTRQTIYSGNDVAGAPSLELGANGGTNRIAAIISGTFVAVTADDAFVPQTWNHIVYRRSGNGAGTHSFHVNGVSKSLGTNNANNYTSTTAVKRIGERTSGSQRFVGLLDEVVVYDRLISTTEIAAHYAILGQIPTADAVKLKTQAGSLTADAVIVARSFTVNATKLKTTSGTRNLNAVIKRLIQPGSFTADAVRGRVPGTFTADAVKFKTLSSTRTADAVKRATQPRSFTADARKTTDATTSSSLTADAVKRKTISGSFTSNAVKSRRIFVDTFTRTTTPLEYLGTPWYWVDYDSISGFSADVLAYTDGSSIVLPQGDWYDSYAGFPLPTAGDLYFDFEVPTWDDADNTPTYGFSLNRSLSAIGVYVRPSTATDWVLGEDTNDTDYTFTPTVGDWWRVHLRWNGTTTMARVWNRSGTEPSTWGFSKAQGWTIYSHAVGIVPYLDFWYFPLLDEGRIDNVEVWTSVPTWFGFGGFQAEARIGPRFTANASIARPVSGSTVLRAMLRKTIASSFTADAVKTLDGRRFGSISADAWIFSTGISTSFTANANFVPVSQRDPGRGQGADGGNTGGGGGGGQGADRDIFIRWDGIDITDDVKYDMTKFIGSVSGRPGEFEMVVVDRDHIYDFTAGKTVTVDIGGRRVWAGWALVVSATYAFQVDDTTSPGAEDTPRWWMLAGPDVNLLFARRYVYDKENPANGNLKKWDPETADGDIIRYVVRHYTDLEADGITLNLSDVGTPVPDKRGPGGAVPGRSFGEFMYFVSQLSGGIGYIDPTMVLHYEDDDTEDAPFRLSDRPDDRSNYAGVADFRMMSNGSTLINDAQVWGAGEGKSVMTYSREEADTSISRHGRWQEGDLRYDMYKQATVNRTADSYVHGSPQNLRGHKNDQPIYRARVFRDGLTAGMKVRVESEVFGVEEVIPIRMMTITFPTPYNPVYELEMSHELDAIWSMSEWPPLPKIPRDDGGGGVRIPPDVDPPEIPEDEPGGCSDEVCGITDSFTRTQIVGWGTSDYGSAWVTPYAYDAVYSVSGSYASIVSGDDEAGQQRLPLPNEGAPDKDIYFDVRIPTLTGLSGNNWAFDVWYGGGFLSNGEVVMDYFPTGHSDSPFGTLGGIPANSIYLAYTDSDLVVEDSVVQELEVGVWYSVHIRLSHTDQVASARVWVRGETEPSTYSLVADFSSTTGAWLPGETVFGVDTIAGIEIDELDINGLNRCDRAGVFDSFTRTVAAGSVGTSDYGMAWNTFGISGSLSVDGDELLFIGPAGVSTNSGIWTGGPTAPWTEAPTFTVRTDFAISTLPVFPKYASWGFEFYDNDGWGPRIGVQITSGAPLSAFVYAEADHGAEEANIPTVFVANTTYFVLLEVTPGVSFKGKVWRINEAEPSSWTFDLPDTSQDPFVGQPFVEVDVTFINSQSGGTGSGVLARSIWTSEIAFEWDGMPCVPGATTVAIDDFDDREITLAPAVGGVTSEGTILGPISSGTGDVWVNGGQWIAGDPSDVWYGVEGGVGRIRHTNRGGVLIVASLMTLTDDSSNYTPWGIDGAGAPDFLFTQPQLTYSIDVMVDQGLSYMEIAIATGWENGDSVTFGVEPDGYFVDTGLGDFDYPMLFEDGVWYTYKVQMTGSSAAAKVWERGTSEPDWASAAQIVPRPWHNESPYKGEFTIMLQSEGLLGSYTNFYVDNFVQYTDIGQSDPTTSEIPPGANSYGCEVATRTSATTYTVSYLIAPSTSQVTVNGLTYVSGIDYTTSASIVTFTNPVASDAVVYVCYRGL